MGSAEALLSCRPECLSCRWQEWGAQSGNRFPSSVKGKASQSSSRSHCSCGQSPQASLAHNYGSSLRKLPMPHARSGSREPQGQALDLAFPGIRLTSAYPVQKSDSRSSSLSILCARASIVSKSVRSWGWNSIGTALSSKECVIIGAKAANAFRSASRR